MLRITQQDSAKDAKRYYASADYYSEGQEIVGSWGGKGAEMLGLHGVVDRESFDRLCDNRNPANGRPLTVRTRTERTVGYDFTFSVPKSVSLLYARTGDEHILGAFRSAVAETMRDIESEMKTRVRKGGRDEERPTGNMVWAEFIHTTSRPVDGVPDPQLHAHCFTFNSTWDDKESRWKAGQFRGLKADAPHFQAAFRVRLAGKLQDLGFGVARKRDDFEVAGVPASVIRGFSRRTEEIEKIAAEEGITNPKWKAELGAKTREAKNHELSWDELRKRWESRLTDKERQSLDEAYRRQVPYARPVRGEGLAVDHAIEHCFTRESVVSERKLLTEAMKRGLGAVTVEGIRAELASRPLIRGEKDGRALATTQDLKDAESRLIAFAREGRGRLRPVGDPARPISRTPFNDDQKAAVRHVLGSRDRVTIIRGAAGTGKTTLEDELRRALEESGVPVAAIAQSTTAVNELHHEAGFAKPVTIAHFFKDEKMQASVQGGLVLVDEASLVGTRDMLRLFDIVQGQDARIVLVGDKRQHRSVSAGEPLRLLEERAGIKPAEVTQIVRQKGDYRKAAKALSDGKTAEGFAELDRLGWITEIPHAGRNWVLAQGYLSAILEKKKNGQHKTALVVSPTHAEGSRITGFIRDALKADGRLGPEKKDKEKTEEEKAAGEKTGETGKNEIEERTFAVWLPAQLTDPEKTDPTNYGSGDMLQFHQNMPGRKKGSRLLVADGEKLPLQYADRYAVYRPGQLSLAVKDRVRITANGWTKDGKHKLGNGSLFSVQGFTKQGDIVIDHGWVIGRDFGHVAYGYVVTSHAAEGKTVDKVFAGISSQSFPATNQRTLYVALTRGREQAVVFTDDKKELLRAAERPDEPLSALALAEAHRRKPSLRQRLHKLLAFRRRSATFAQTHEQKPTVHRSTPFFNRENVHVR